MEVDKDSQEAEMRKIIGMLVLLVFIGGCTALPALNTPANSQLRVVDKKLENKEVDAIYKLSRFIVYDEQAMNDNNGFVPSGWMGDYGAIMMDYNNTNNPHSGKYCQKWAYSGKKTNKKRGWVGVYWQNPPNNWGNIRGGLNLSHYTSLKFWARGEKGGEIVKFGMGGISGKYPDTAAEGTSKITLTKRWKEYKISLDGQNLSRIIGGFFWRIENTDNPSGCIFYLDDIIYK
jgi:hypothetical protein